jgi:hypothetical protein
MSSKSLSVVRNISTLLGKEGGCGRLIVSLGEVWIAAGIRAESAERFSVLSLVSYAG